MTKNFLTGHKKTSSIFNSNEAHDFMKQGRNKVPITGGARYLFIFPISETYIGRHITLLGSSVKTGGAMAPPAPPVPTALSMKVGLSTLLSKVARKDTIT